MATTCEELVSWATQSPPRDAGSAHENRARAAGVVHPPTAPSRHRYRRIARLVNDTVRSPGRFRKMTGTESGVVCSVLGTKEKRSPPGVCYRLPSKVVRKRPCLRWKPGKNVAPSQDSRPRLNTMKERMNYSLLQNEKRESLYIDRSENFRGYRRTRGEKECEAESTSTSTDRPVSWRTNWYLDVVLLCSTIQNATVNEGRSSRLAQSTEALCSHLRRWKS